MAVMATGSWSWSRRRTCEALPVPVRPCRPACNATGLPTGSCGLFCRFDDSTRMQPVASGGCCNAAHWSRDLHAGAEARRGPGQWRPGGRLRREIRAALVFLPARGAAVHGHVPAGVPGRAAGTRSIQPSHRRLARRNAACRLRAGGAGRHADAGDAARRQSGRHQPVAACVRVRRGRRAARSRSHAAGRRCGAGGRPGHPVPLHARAASGGCEDQAGGHAGRARAGAASRLDGRPGRRARPAGRSCGGALVAADPATRRRCAGKDRS